MQQPQKRPAVIITGEQFTQLMNHYLVNNGMYVSTGLIEEAKTEGAPATQGFNVILGQNTIFLRSEVLQVLNTYCEKVSIASHKEMGLIAQCEVLIGETSTLPEQNIQEEETDNTQPDSPEQEG